MNAPGYFILDYLTPIVLPQNMSILTQKPQFLTDPVTVHYELPNSNDVVGGEGALSTASKWGNRL